MNGYDIHVEEWPPTTRNGGLIMKPIANAIKAVVDFVAKVFYNDGYRDTFKERS